ncbi:hypothetical protein D3C80_1876970 [compost metagenome]
MTEQILNMKMSENAKLNQRVIDLNENTLRLKNELDSVSDDYNRIKIELDSNLKLNENSRSIIA